MSSEIDLFDVIHALEEIQYAKPLFSEVVAVHSFLMILDQIDLTLFDQVPFHKAEVFVFTLFLVIIRPLFFASHVPGCAHHAFHLQCFFLHLL